MRSVRRVFSLLLFLLCCVWVALAQSSSGQNFPHSALPATQATCDEAPQDDALVSLCAPPSLSEEDSSPVISEPFARITLNLPNDTPLRIALDQRTRIDHPGEIVHGKVVESVYAFDRPVIPAGSMVTGRVTSIAPVSGMKRTLSYANGDFSPFHKYEVTFDTLTLPGGKQVSIKTSVSPGTAEVVHLVSDPSKAKQKNAAARATENAKHEAGNKVHDAENKVHDAMTQIKSPGRLHRLKQMALAQLPYRRQYLEPGTRFNASLLDPLDFGETMRTHAQLAAIGATPAPDSLLHARLVAGVSSATANRGTPVTAVLTEPLYSPDHHLILPANSRLVGEVLQAKPARKLHHNGDLRLIFERIETPEGTEQAMQGNLEGMEVDRASGMKMDEEGGAHATDSKKRYLSTALVLALAGWGVHPEYEHGTVSIADGAGKQAGAGFSGLKFTGALMSIAARSAPVSIAFGVYGASASVYSNFLSRGHDVVLPKDTPLEIGFGNPRAAGNPPKQP